VYLGLRALGLPHDSEYDVVLPFQILNLALLLGTVLLWSGIADATGLSVSGRWFGALLLFVNFACLKFLFYLPVLTDGTAFFLGALLVYGYVTRKPWLTWAALVAGAFTWPAFLIPGGTLLLWRREPVPDEPAGRKGWLVTGGIGALYLIGVAIALRFPVYFITDAVELGLVELNRTWLPVSLVLALGLLVMGFRRLFDRAALLRASTYVVPLSARRLALLGATWIVVQCVVRWYASPAPSVNPFDVFVRYLVLQPVLRPAQAPVAHVVFFGLLPLFLLLRWKAVCRAAHGLGIGMTLFLASLALLAISSETRQLLHGLVALTLLASLAVDNVRFPRWAPWVFGGLALFATKLWFPLNHGGFTAKSPPASYPAQYWFMNAGPWMADEMYALQGSLALAGLLVVALAFQGARQLSPEASRLVWPSTRRIALVPAVALSVLCVCGAVEWSARLYLSRAAARSRQDPLSVPDAALGWSNVPGRGVRLRTREYDVAFDVNRLGLRGPEPRPAKSGTRVLLLGGSLAEGYAVSDPASLRARLETGLREAGCAEPEILNAGVAGYSLEQQFLRQASLADTLRPDATVVVFNHEDLIETLRAASGIDDEEGAEETGRAAHLPAWLRQPPRSVHRFKGSAILRLFSNLTESWPTAYRTLAGWGLTDYGPPPAKLWPFGPRDEATIAWTKAKETLAGMKALTATSGGSLLLLDGPSRFEVDADEWRRVLERHRMSERFWKQDRVARRLRAIAEDLDLTLADPRPALAAAQSSSTPAYWPIARTWNERGHALAAAALLPPLARTLHCAGH